MTQMASRIFNLEKSLARPTDGLKTDRDDSTKPVPDAKNRGSSEQPVKQTHSSNLSDRSRDEIVVQKGSSSQYFNEVLLSRVIEEVGITDVNSKSRAIRGSDR